MSEFFMSTKYGEDVLKSSHEAIQSGRPIAEVIKTMNLSYSPVWCFHTWTLMQESGEAVDLTGKSAKQAARIVANLRKKGQSWGLIACTVSRTESACRRMYESATDIQATGTRTGKGGRFWGDNEALYTGATTVGDRASFGIRVTPGTTNSEAEADVEANNNEG